MKQQNIIIGTRGSKLALWQAHYTKNALEKARFNVSIKIIQTKGDRIQNLSFDKIEGKGFFTKEIEQELIDGKIDLAVHSYKDLPTIMPPSLYIAASSYRENPLDVLLIKPDAYDENEPLKVKKDATIGTSSARRKSQLLALQPSITLHDIRGNVPTRIEKLRNGNFDAIMLAAAGLERLQLPIDDLKIYTVPHYKCIPAPAQGVLAYQVRAGDKRMISICMQYLHNEAVAAAIEVERKLLNKLEGGCRQPIGIFCQQNTNEQGEKIFEIWASKAVSENAYPNRVYLQEQHATQAVQSAFNSLTKNNKVKDSVFISRDLQADSLLYKGLQAKDYQPIYSETLINFSAAIFDVQKIEAGDYDIIFFSSKNAVRYFFETLQQQDVTLPTFQYAAVGPATADVLRKYGKTVHFEGSGNNIATIAADFNKFAINKRVLFPQAKNSRQSIQQFSEDYHFTNLVVYNNVPKSKLSVPLTDALIMTSPMNVAAYFNAFPERKNSFENIVAIGEPTAIALQQCGIAANNITTAYLPNEQALADCLP